MARLPIPGKDAGTWGDVLNDYLSQAHKGDGALKDNAVTANVLAPNSITNAAIADNAVTATHIADGSITEVLLDSGVQTKLDATGDWGTLSNKPAVIAGGADAAAARDAIGAGGQRRKTVAEWAADNVILGVGEEGYETDTGRCKRGNGADVWSDLPYTDLVIPEAFGAVGDGASDCKAGLEAARMANAIVALYPGRTYRINANATIGVLLNLGGLIQVDSGVTLVFDDVIGSDSIPVFAGDGIARSRINRFSVGWYGNGDFSDAWDFCRRGFREHYFQECIIPSAPDGNFWNHSRPIEFDDPENLTVFKVDNSRIRATAPMDSQLIFSTDNKTEDIRFEGKIELDGNGYATDSVLVQGGARIRFLNELVCYNPLRDGVRLNVVHAGIDQFYVNFLRAVGYGAGGASGWALNVLGDGIIQGLKVDHIFCNGISSDYAGAAADIGIVNLEGFIMGADISYITENSGSIADGQAGLAYLPTAASLVRIAASPAVVGSGYRAPQAVNIGTIFAFKHYYNLLKVENGGAGTVKPNFTVGMLDRYVSLSNTAHIADIDFCYNSSINFGRQVASLGSRAMKLGPDATNLFVNGIRSIFIENTSGVWDGFIANGVEGFEQNVADDGVVAFKPRQSNGILHVKFGVATSGYAIIQWRTDNQAAIIAKHPDVDVAVGTVLTGTEGIDGRGAVSIVSGTVYFENRYGSTRIINAKFL